MSALLLVNEVSKKLRCSSQHVYDLSEAGVLPVVVWSSRGSRKTYRWRSEDVEKLITDHLVRDGGVRAPNKRKDLDVDAMVSTVLDIKLGKRK